MIRNHAYQEGDSVLIAIPEGWWEEGGEATKSPFATRIGETLQLEAEIVEFSSSGENGEIEDTVKVENVRGEIISIDLEWIKELIRRREDD